MPLLANGQTPEQRAIYNRQYKAIPENMDKIRARDTLRRAIRYGRMIRQPCDKCGADKTHGHHDNYSKPLEVRWLCHFCHAAEHSRVGLFSSAPRKQCLHGHALTGENLFVSRGARSLSAMQSQTTARPLLEAQGRRF